MNAGTAQRLFAVYNALDHPVTRALAILILAVLAFALLATLLLPHLGILRPDFRRDRRDRLRSWLILIPLMAGPVFLGAAWVIAAVAVLSLLGYAEFARATGLLREKAMSLVVVLGILCLTFAAADHWYGLFVALAPLTLGALATVSVPADRPQGYIQRVGLGMIGFLLFGVGLGHLGYFANDRDYRPLILMLLVTVEFNDACACGVGKSIGGPKLLPRTSPNKTISGSLGALTLTTLLTAGLAHYVFRGQVLDTPARLLILGLLVAASAQLGELILSSIKRDSGANDQGVTFPGHGGVLDRCNGLLLAAPAVFHYVAYYRGIGQGQATRIFTGS